MDESRSRMELPMSMRPPLEDQFPAAAAFADAAAVFRARSRLDQLAADVWTAPGLGEKTGHALMALTVFQDGPVMAEGRAALERLKARQGRPCQEA